MSNNPTARQIDETPKTTEWVTASNDGGGCVYMRRVGTTVELKDSKTGNIQTYNLLEIDHLLQGARDGVFDHLVY